jgi:hypothetical protein
MGLEPPSAGNEITRVAEPKLLHLALGLKYDSEARTPPTAGIAMLPPDYDRFLDHVSDNSQIG